MDDTPVRLQAVRKMDAEALAKVFDLYSPAIFKYVFRHCGDATTADQIVGDVFEKLLEQLSQGRGPTSDLRLSLFEIAYHELVDEIRQSRSMTSISTIEKLPPANSTDITAGEQARLESILWVIQCDLTDDQRHVIILRFLEDFSLKETALIMGKKEKNIKVTQNRAVATLHKALDDQSEGQGTSSSH